MSARFAEITRQMMQRLPHWFRMRKDPNSVGAQFLNVIGLEFADLQELLDYAARQYYIGTADLNQADIVYKASLPLIPDGMTVQFFGDGFQLQAAPNLTEFLTALATDTLHNPEVFYENPYYLDEERRLVYVREPYGSQETPPCGYVTLVVIDQVGRIITTEDLPLVLHAVWNFLDEFGLLLDTPRLYGERNADYKERLLSVFRFPANSTRRGLHNGIARELGTIATATWADGGSDLPLPYSRVTPETILVDGAPFPASRLRVDGSGRTILSGNPAFAGTQRFVQYAHGVTVLALGDRSQDQFQDQLFTPDGHGRELLEHYADVVTDQVPVNWGQFLWDQSFWDVGQTGVSGDGLVPSFRDAQVTGWRNYKGQSR